MAARAMASGTVSFGLVAIPVKLYTTSESSGSIRFSMVHRDCGTKLKQQYVCPTHDEVVERSDIAKGYEFARDQYVLFSKEELEAITPPATHAIEIAEFVPLDQVDPIHYEKAYYLGPDKGGVKPYRLLSEAMRETGRAALARYAARGKDYLVLLRPFEEGILMQQLRYADEIRSFSEVPVGQAEVREQELELALRLIEQIASDEFEPERYEDEVGKRVRELVDSKVAGEEIVAAPPEAPRAQIVDLMAALKASLGEAEAEETAGAKPARKPAKRAPRKGAAKRSGKGAARGGGSRRKKSA